MMFSPVCRDMPEMFIQKLAGLAIMSSTVYWSSYMKTCILELLDVIFHNDDFCIGYKEVFFID